MLALTRSLKTALFVCATALLSPLSAALAEPPVCKGENLLNKMKTEQPQDYARIEAEGRKFENASNLLWKLEKPGTPPNFLFGTVHLSEDRINNRSAAVQTALDNTDRIALEIADLSPTRLASAIGESQHLLVYRDGRSLETQLTPEERQTAGAAIEKLGMPAAALKAIRPWVITMTLAVTDCERQRTQSGLKTLDASLGDYGRVRGIPVIGLETIESQLTAMARIPEPDQIAVLKASLKLLKLNDDVMATMVDLYLSRDIGKILPFQAELWRRAGYSTDIFMSFQRELITVRNASMRDAALPLLAKGGTFIAVGALHLPGRDGLVSLFREAGYDVQPIE